MSLKGNLRNFGLGEILQSLALNRHTGTLSIVPAGEGAEPIHIQVANGQITFLSNPASKGFRLGDMLVRRRRATREDIERALALQKDSGGTFGAVLLGQGILSHEDLADALTFQLQEGLYDLFLLREGEFEFRMGEDPPCRKDPSEREVKIAVDPQAVIAEGIRRLDAWAELSKRVPSFDEIFTRTCATPGELTPDEADLYALIDGRRPAHELCARCALARLPGAKALAALLEARLIRPLDLPEIVKIAATTSDDERPAFLTTALRRDPRNVDLRLALADTYTRRDDRKQALRVLAEGLEDAASLSPGDARRLADTMLLLNPSDERAHRFIIDTALRRDAREEAMKYSISLVEILSRRGKNEEARQVLAAVNDFVPDDPAVRLAVASKWRSIGDPKSGIPHMEHVARHFESAQNSAELVKVLRWILDADQTRHDVKFRLSQISQRMARELKRQRRKIAFLACGGGLIALAVAFPIVYQIRAGTAYGEVEGAREALLAKRDFDRMEALYASFVDRYGWSTWVDEAKRGIAEVRRLRDEHEGTLKVDRDRELERQARLREQPTKLLAEATKAEQSGDLETAFQLLRQLKSRFPDSPSARGATFPLMVTSRPPGAEVWGDEGKRLIGRTPLKLRYAPDRELVLTLRSPGCEDAVLRATKETTWSASVDLRWKPIAQFTHPGPVHGDLVIYDNAILFSSRDGYLYLLDPLARKIRWRRRVGCYGDPVSGLLIKGETISVGNVEGDLWTIEGSTGQSTGHVRLPGPATLAPVAGENDEILVATTNGRLVRVKDSEILGSVAVEGAIACAPLLVDGTVLVGTSCDVCCGFRASDLAPAWRAVLDGDVVAGPVRCGSVAAVATLAKTLSGIDPATGERRWDVALAAPVSAPLSATNAEIYVGLESGEISIVSANGKVLGKGTGGTGSLGSALAIGSKLYFGGQTGSFACFDIPRGSVTWSFDAPAPIVARPCVLNGKMLFATVKGNFFFMEILP